jgi:glycine dehydrogenase subunit 1
MALKSGEGAGRNRVLLPAGLHPEYRQVLETYLAPRRPVIESYTGRLAQVAAAVSGNDLACLVAAYPDFFGVVPDFGGQTEGASDAAAAVHAKGGLFIVAADPIMLGLFKSPGELGADIVTAEGQCLGNDLNYGGPFLGIMAVKEALMRRIPGRIVGQAQDGQGRRGFVLTLAAREQHIRREKAVSNICSNEGLAMLRACIYLALMGRTGLRKTAELCWHNSHYAAEKLAAIPGCSIGPGTFFKEFVLKLPKSAEKASEALFERGIVPGLPLSRYFPDRPGDLLICVTEKNSRQDIDVLAQALEEYCR